MRTVLVLMAMTVIFSCNRTSSTSGEVSVKKEAETVSSVKENTVRPGTGKRYFDLFDTVSTIYSYAEDTESEFDERSDLAYDTLNYYHRLGDIYYEYSGMNNLKTVNDNAGNGEWIDIDPLLTEFLIYAREMYYLTDGEMNIMMGAVLNLWHDARESEEHFVPSMEELLERSRHTDFSLLEIDEENSRVRITDEEASIDCGALMKGYATEMAAKALIDEGVDHYVLNIGGNIRIIGEKLDGSGWSTGIRDPQNPDDAFKLRLMISDTACVTSGTYERYFMVDGKKYHHIIDKDTLLPANYYDSLTVLTLDSGLADCLSTALFCMDYEAGLALCESLGNVECVWIFPSGEVRATDGIEDRIIN